MDTKSKNIKTITKVTCCLLCIGLLFLSSKMVVDCYFAVNFFASDKIMSDEKRPDFTATRVFNQTYADDVQTIMNYATSLTPDADRKTIRSKKADFIKTELDSYKAFCAEYPSGFDDYMNSDDILSGFFKEYRIKCGENEYWINTDYVYYSGYEFNSYGAYSEVEAKLNNIFDDYLLLPAIPQYGSNFSDYTQSLDSVDGMYYYVSYNGTMVSNFPENVTYKSVLNQDYGVAFENGRLMMSKNMNGFRLGNSVDFDNEIDAYFYVDTENGKYANMLQNYNLFYKKNIRNELIFAVIGMALSVAFFVLTVVLTGRRDENGKIKLLFVDYIPFEIHLALSGGIIGFCIFAFTEWLAGKFSVSNCSYYTIKSLLVSALFAAIYAIALELITSTARLCRSEKKFYKGTLCYYLCLLIKKLFKYVGNKFSYRIKNFKSGLIAALISYGVVNFVLLVASIVCLGLAHDGYTDAFIFGILSAILIFIINAVFVVFVSRYAVSLDKIINAAFTNTLPSFNRKKLPKSLNALLKSLHYSKQELDAAVDKAVRDERMRTELITNVSHDIKTPITSIITYSDLLSTCDMAGEPKEYATVIKEKATTLKRLVDDLIESSKINAGVINLNPVNLSLSELVAEAVVEENQQFSDNGLDLIFKGDQTNVFAFADGTKTYRVVDNLLSNALKYSVKGSRVYADVYYLNDAAVFEIKNISSQPLNITPDELTKRFVQGDRSRSEEGNGLGLSIVSGLCEAMGGCLNITIDGDLFKARMMLPKSKETEQLAASVDAEQLPDSQDNM